MDDICLNITSGSSEDKAAKKKKQQAKARVAKVQGQKFKDAKQRVKQQQLAQIVARNINKNLTAKKEVKEVKESKDVAKSEEPKAKPIIMARKRNVEGGQKKTLTEIFSSDKKVVESEVINTTAKKPNDLSVDNDAKKEINFHKKDPQTSDERKPFKKFKKGPESMNKFKDKQKYNPGSEDGSKKIQNKPGQKTASLFGNNPDIPRIGQRLVKPINETVFAVSSFKELGIHPYTISNLEQNMQITKMTTVQQKAIPIILSGKDALVRSQTGSGKTLAYALPIVESLQKIRPKLTRNCGLKALVVVPTRELALQTYECFIKLIKSFQWIVPGYLVGGEKRKSEKARLRRGCNILVCTPGRLLDHLKHTESLKLNEVKYFVLDEADRMLDMGYEKDVSEIVNALKEADEAPKESDYDALSMLRQNSKKKFTDEELEEEKILEEKAEEKDQDEIEESVEKKEYHSGTDSESEEPLVKSKKPKIVSNVVIKKSKKEGEVKEQQSEVDVKQSESHKRQTILLSATLTQSVEKLAGITLKNPVFIDAAKDNLESIDGDTNLVNEDLIVPQSVVQTYVVTPPKLRMVTLCAYIAGKCQSAGQHKIIVFMATQDMLDYHSDIMSMVLNKPRDEEDEDSEPLVDVEFFKLHGSMSQKDRTEVFKTFRNARSGVLLCTDVAARGLDLPKVDTVIQYTGPTSARDYVHRIGRTARAGSSGSAIIFLTPPEVEFVRMLESKRIRIKQEDMNSILDKLIGPLSNHRNAQVAATSLQNEFENLVLEQKKLHVMACKAYASWVRFYSSYPKEMREIFNRKDLHLGHYAKSFALRETPQKIGSVGKVAKEKETKPTHNNRLANERPDGTQRKRARSETADRRPAMLKNVRMLNVSEFDSGLEPIKKPRT